MPTDLQAVNLEIGMLIFAVFTAIAIWKLIKHRDPLVLFCVLGGLGMTLLEPICNVLGLAYHPEIGQIAAFTAMDRKIPWHIVLVFPCFFAGFTWLMAHLDARRIPVRKFWILVLATILVSFVFELSPVHDGLWLYYGEQPLRIWGMPLWWYVANPTAMIGSASLAVLATRGLAGWKRWPLILIVPVLGVGIHTGVAAPVYVAMNSGASPWLGAAATAVTLAFGLVIVWMCGRLLFQSEGRRV
ncbi:MAG: hypothetical protein JSR19_09585 [Proteobacteria bacterium]|nr:hypothetical protein [Pseudomonadota bacterium]HQR04096.1 hypothetical protein [Rhodocyclaceae bacterium]